MSYKSETIAAILPRINDTYFLPAMQREFIWAEEQICALFDSLMRGYPISSFLFWRGPVESGDNVESGGNIEAYNFLLTVKKSDNRANRLERRHSDKDIIFVLDGQQRLTALLSGL